jgi:hypothetical protein
VKNGKAKQTDSIRIRNSVRPLGARNGNRPRGSRNSQPAQADRLHDGLKAAAIDGREKSGRARPGKSGARLPANIKQKETGKQMLGDILRAAFGGSALRLVQQVLETETTPDDLKEIRRMIERAERMKN